MDFVETLWLVKTKIEVISNGSGVLLLILDNNVSRVKC